MSIRILELGDMSFENLVELGAVSFRTLELGDASLRILKLGDTSLKMQELVRWLELWNIKVR